MDRTTRNILLARFNDDDERYPSTGQRCPECGHSFRVLADEYGMHECPRCGFHPHDNDEPDDDDRDDLEEPGDLEGTLP